MSNTSATGGYLAPLFTPPADDLALEKQIQPVIVGISGLSPKLVRPAWQQTPPAQPAPEETWAAFRITDIQSDVFPVVQHNSAGDGSDKMQRHETLTVLVSFYGPSAQGAASLFRDGLHIRQNLDALYAANMALVEASEIVAAPALTNTQWIRRYDLTMTLRRQIDRTYAVLNLLSAQGTISFDNQDHPLSQPWTSP